MKIVIKRVRDIMKKEISDNYKKIIEFSKENPLPKTVEGLADALMDIVKILCEIRMKKKSWDRLSIHMSYRGSEESYPGAFLSNPCFLPSTVNKIGGALAYGGMPAGCFFKYPHYQEDSLGPALLLCAFSPRTLKAKRSAMLYAQAMMLLVEESRASEVSVNVNNDKLNGEEILKKVDFLKSVKSASFNLTFNKEQLSRLTHLKTDLAAKAIRLALTDKKSDLFDESSRKILASLASEREAMMEANVLNEIIQPGQNKSYGKRNGL